MEHREHRRVILSEIGGGGCALAGAFGPADSGELGVLLRRAHDPGVTLYDTAGDHGDAQAVLGEAVRPFRDGVIVARSKAPLAQPPTAASAPRGPGR